MTETHPRRRALVAICVFVVAVGAWNVLHYPPAAGYDGADHIAYADGLVPDGRFPQHTGEYYTPPGYYAVAGSLDWVAGKLDAGEPHRAGMAVNILFLLGTLLLVSHIARELWPGRERVALGAAAFIGLAPMTVKAEAMFHPEVMSLFLATLAVWLCIRTFADGRYAWALGVALGAVQLVRAFGLWTVAAVVITLVVGRRWRALAIVVVLAALIPSPWYIHQRLKYGGHPEFTQPVTSQKPLYERRPLGFYLNPGFPAVVTRPYGPHFRNLALPTTYTELWGDYFGVWIWHNGAQKPDGAVITRPTSEQRHWLVLQSLLGILPTLLALGGWLAFLRASLRSPPRLVVALLPLLGIVGYLYFTVSYPTPDGDVLKGSFMLSTTAGWALGFGYALERLRGRLGQVTLALLAVCVLAELPFLVYG